MATIQNAAIAGELYKDRILRDAPVGYWRLGDAVGSGTVVDNSGNGNPGTIVGGVTLGQAATIADGDTAAVFNGTTGYITMGDVNAFEFTAAFSVEFWFKTSTGAWQDWVSKWDLDSFTSGGWGIEQRPTGAIHFFANNASGLAGGWNALTAGQYADGVWHHYVATWDGTLNANGVKLYVDGVLDKQITASAVPTPQTTRPFTAGASVGSVTGAQNFVAGALDEVALYAFALTAQQVADHYALRFAAIRRGISLIDHTWSLGPTNSSVAGGNFSAVEAMFPPTYSVLYCEGSTLASTQSFSFQTAAHSTGPWVTEGSIDLQASSLGSGWSALRLTGPYNWMRPWLNSVSTGTYNLRLIGATPREYL